MEKENGVLLQKHCVFSPLQDGKRADAIIDKTFFAGKNHEYRL